MSNVNKLHFFAVQKYNYKDCDSLVVAIMTHGINNSFYLSDGTACPVSKLLGYFEAHKCPTLVCKPKLFIIQVSYSFVIDL